MKSNAHCLIKVINKCVFSPSDPVVQLDEREGRILRLPQWLLIVMYYLPMVT